MIQQRPATTDVTRMGPWAALFLAAGLSAGFIAGQVAPDVAGALFGTSATVVTDAPALPQNADYGIRHLTTTTTPLTEVDDYGTRHLTTTPLTEVDDYGTRDR